MDEIESDDLDVFRKSGPTGERTEGAQGDFKLVRWGRGPE